MADNDKYPDDSERRRFVKGVVGSATLAGVGTATAGALNTVTHPTGEGGGTTQYYGVENTDGPAPRAMPQIPVEIDDEGYLMGVYPEPEEVTEGGKTVTVARMEIGGIEYSPNWFQYCGVQNYPGVQPTADQDNYFRYTGSSKYDWQNEDVEAGGKVHIDDFEDYEDWGNDIGSSGLGKPASATWRSQDVSANEGILPIQIIRSAEVEQAAQNDEWLGASTEKGFMAILNKCTHFCCVPSYKGLGGAESFGAEDMIYCQCHQSIYDPFNVVKKSFVALPRPEE